MKAHVLALVIAIAPFAAAEELPRVARLGVSPSNSTTCFDSVVLEYSSGRWDEIEDVYLLDLPRAANVTLELSYPNSSANFELFLMAPESDRRLNLIAAVSSPEPKRITTQLSAGKYYIGVSAVEGTSTYALALSAPELFGSSNVDIAAKLVRPCNSNRPWTLSDDPGVKATVVVSEPLSAGAKSETIFEEISDQALTPQPDDNTLKRRGVLKPPPCTYSVPTTTQSVTSSAGSGSVDVTATSGCAWTASTTASWLTITSGKSGFGNGTVSYSFVANTSSSSRTGTLSVAGKSVSVTQFAACTYTVSPTTQAFTSAGGSGTISMTTRSDCAWTTSVSTSATWISITSGQSGMGNGSVTYSVGANASTSSRSGTITIGGRSVSISQSPDVSLCTYSLAYTSKTITWCGGERTIKVTTQGDCPWSATSDSSWLTVVLGDNRSGTRDLSYTVAQNTTTSSRQGKITVAGMQATITQNPRSGNGTYDGNWSGTTSSNRAVSMCVAEGAIQNISISVRLDFITFACITPLIRQSELAITGNTFSGSVYTYPEVSSISTTARGTFTSSTAVNGSWDPYSGSYFIICGSTIGFGTGGSILSSGTFTATKQP